jgi:hypothetical protein
MGRGESRRVWPMAGRKIGEPPAARATALARQVSVSDGAAVCLVAEFDSVRLRRCGADERPDPAVGRELAQLPHAPAIVLVLDAEADGVPVDVAVELADGVPDRDGAGVLVPVPALGETVRHDASARTGSPNLSHSPVELPVAAVDGLLLAEGVPEVVAVPLPVQLPACVRWRLGQAAARARPPHGRHLTCRRRRGRRAGRRRDRRRACARSCA